MLFESLGKRGGKIQLRDFLSSPLCHNVIFSLRRLRQDPFHIAGESSSASNSALEIPCNALDNRAFDVALEPPAVTPFTLQPSSTKNDNSRDLTLRAKGLSTTWFSKGEHASDVEIAQVSGARILDDNKSVERAQMV